MGPLSFLCSLLREMSSTFMEYVRRLNRARCLSNSTKRAVKAVRNLSAGSFWIAVIRPQSTERVNEAPIFRPPVGDESALP
jgi:hypothetical protein